MAFVRMPRRCARLLIGSCALFLASQLPAVAQTGTWTGAGGDSLWSNGNNWNAGTLPGCNNTAYARFLAVPGSVNQDIPACTLNRIQLDSGLAFSGNGIIFDGSGPLLQVLGGTTTFNNPVGWNQPFTVNVLAGNIVFAGANPPTVMPLNKMGPGQLTITATNLSFGFTYVSDGALVTAQTSVDSLRQLRVDAPGSLTTGPAYWASLEGNGNLNLTGDTEFDSPFAATFSGNISGIGGFVSSGTFPRTLAGNNTFTGGVNVKSGSLAIGNGATGNFPAGPVTLQNNATLTLRATGVATITSLTAPIFTAPTLVVNGGAVNGTGLNLADGFLTINGGNVAATVQTNGGITVNAPGTLGFNGGNFTRDLAGNGTVTINGGTLTISPSTTATFPGVIKGTGFLVKDGGGMLTLSGINTFSGSTTIGAGTLVLTGSLGGTVIAGTGVLLMGTGTIVGSTTMSSGSTLAPGLSPGIINTGSLNMANGSTLNVEIAGPTAGTGYDRVNVTGTVTLNTPTLALSGAYVPVVGDQFVIITNDGADPVTGSFLGLAEGATLTFNGVPMRITYAGGDGNDVALAPVTFAVTPSANAGGTITPNTVQTVVGNATPSFTVAANIGFGLQPVTGTCGGNLVGNTFTATAVVANCTVVANFVINTYTVTSSGGGANGTITPASQPVNHGSTTTFTVTPGAGYTASVGGTCPAGALVGATYTTGAITAPCNVAATFTLNTYPVTSSAGVNGTITPPSQTVGHGATTTFTVTPTTGYTAAIGGTCAAGSLVGTTYTTGVVTAACTVSATFTLNTYAVTASAGANGAITPPSQTVAHGATTTFTVTPTAGYAAVVGGTCPAGTLVGTTYTTGVISAACTVSATFTLVNYTVTSTGGSFGTITPPSQSVAHGSTASFTVTAVNGYSAVVGGTCPAGTLVGTTYTTGAITAPCSVAATFPLSTYTVTATAGANGTITPPSQTAVFGGTATFTVTPNAGYAALVGGTCPAGSLVGTAYTTGLIAAACSVSVSFTATAVTTFIGPTATGTGNATASFTGGGPTCTYTLSQFIPLTGHAQSPPALAPAQFPHGLFDFSLGSCTPGSSIVMTISYPSALPAGTQYWKYGPEPGNATPHWYVMPATITGNTAVFTITDGLQGDDDLAANGTLVDQGGPGAPGGGGGGGASAIPTLSEWAMIALASLLLVAGLRREARRRV